ncbi:MAG: hypothetical protein ABIT96_01690 [Ferruginibacter sp.]
MRVIKVTLKILLIFCLGCRQEAPVDMVAFELELNRQTEASIDSAYKVINDQCDSLVLMQATLYRDSLINAGKK